MITSMYIKTQRR